MNIYVGNLSRDLSETELKEAFAAFGEVSTCNIIKDKFTGVGVCPFLFSGASFPPSVLRFSSS